MFRRRIIFKNSLWGIFEKITSLINLVFINSMVAKYAGPEIFGIITYCGSVFLIIMSIAQWGTESVAAKRVSVHNISGLKILKSTLLFKNSIYFLVSFILLAHILMQHGKLAAIFAFSFFVANLFVLNDIFSTFNYYTYRVRINVLTNILGVLLSFLIRFIIVRFEMNVSYIGVSVILIALVPFFLRILFVEDKWKNVVVNSRERKFYVKYFVYAGGLVAVSNISIAVYLSVNQIFLANYVSVRDLGVYGVALTFGTGWGFVNIAVINAFSPKIYSSDEEECLGYFIFASWLSFIFSLLYFLFFYLFGEYMIDILFGKSYSAAKNIVIYLIVATFLSHIGMLTQRIFIKLSGYRYIAFKSLLTCFLSIPISWFFISSYGVIGAGISFLFIEIFSLTLVNYFFRGGVIFRMHLSIFNISLHKKILSRFIGVQSEC